MRLDWRVNTWSGERSGENLGKRPNWLVWIPMAHKHSKILKRIPCVYRDIRLLGPAYWSRRSFKTDGGCLFCKKITFSRITAAVDGLNNEAASLRTLDKAGVVCSLIDTREQTTNRGGFTLPSVVSTTWVVEDIPARGQPAESWSERPEPIYSRN